LCIKTIVARQGNLGLEPEEPGFGIRSAYVNMRRLERVVLARIKEEPEAIAA
jgi:hypothetical protein